MLMNMVITIRIVMGVSINLVIMLMEMVMQS